MLIDLDVPRDVKDGDMLIYQSGKFVKISKEQLLSDVNKQLDDLQYKYETLEKRINTNIYKKIKEVMENEA